MTLEVHEKYSQELYTAKDRGYWKAIIALLFGSLLIFSTLYSFQPLLPVFVDLFNISPTLSSLVVSSSVFAMLMGLLILGFISDRYGRNRIMILSIVVTVLTLLAMPFANSFALIVFLRLIQGFFLAGIPAAAMGFLGSEVAPRSLGMAMSVYIASNALGGMGGRVTAGYLTDLFGWKTAFSIFAGFGLIAAILFIWLLPRERFFKKSTQPVSHDLRGMAVHLKDRKLILYFCVGLILQIVFTAVWTYLPFYLQGEPFSIPLKWISLTYFAYILGVIAPPIAGKLSAHYSLNSVMAAGIIFFFIGVWLTVIPAIAIIGLGLALVCTGFFIAHSMASSSVTQIATHHKSGASSFYLISYYIGVVLGSTAAGVIWDVFSWIGIAATSLLLMPLVWMIFKSAHSSSIEKTNSIITNNN